MRFIIITLLLLIVVKSSFAQLYEKNSIDSVIVKTISSVTGRFIIQKPLKNKYSLFFDTSQIVELFDKEQFAVLRNKYKFLKDNDFEIDKSTIDTTDWNDADFAGKILIDNHGSELDYKDLLIKYHLQPSKKLRDSVWSYNNDDCYRRKISTMISKPVFNSSKTLCSIEIVEKDICNEGRSESTYWFYKKNETWNQFEIVFWRKPVY